MGIAILNGSPKKTEGATLVIINLVKEILGEDIEVFQGIDFLGKTERERKIVIDNILKADTLLIAFPLYVDSLPMPLIKTLEAIEKESKNLSLPKVYGISQCGFYEASQNKTALKIVENFCERLSLRWQFGIGIGAGVLLNHTKDIKHGPTKPIYDGICFLCKDINKNLDEKRENVYISPSLPRFLYKLGGNMMWRKQAKINKVADKINLAPFQREE